MKKLWTILCAVLLIFALTACGKEKEIDSTKMQATINNMLNQCMFTDSDQIEQLKSVRSEELDLALIQYGFPCDSSVYIKVLQSWVDAQEEMGAFVSVGEFEFSESNGEINATAEAEYEQRNAEMTFTFEENGDLKALSVGARYTTGEILKKAGLNTIIGMGIVFIVLIFIAIIIWIMGKILAPKKKKVQEVKEDIAAVPVKETAPEIVNDDTELIAVISAAIAAASGTSSDGFVVRSIKRRSDNKWNRA